MTKAPIYDGIGKGYAGYRQPDVRIAGQIHRLLGGAETVLNVGAGTGSYEPAGRQVTALEPSAEMIKQRPAGAAPVVQGVAENLPFADNAFDAAMAVLTVHHWTDLTAGLKEMRRVAKGRLVVLTFDPESSYFWLADYLPEIIELDQPIMPKLSRFSDVLGQVKTEKVLVPHDCTDGFLGCYWRRPEAYLDDGVRASISTFSMIDDVDAKLAPLRADIESGIWADRYGHLLGKATLDVGYRLVCHEPV